MTRSESDAVPTADESTQVPAEAREGRAGQGDAPEATPDAVSGFAAEAGAETAAEVADEVAAGVAHDESETSAEAAAGVGDDVPGEEAGAAARMGRPRKRAAELEREGEVAADFLETLLDICDLDGDLDVDIDGDRAAVSIVDSEEGRVPRRLVGVDGKVLDALQELTRLAVQTATGERSRLMLDVAGHRAARRAAIVEIAGVAIAEVKGGSNRVALEPMTAFERKVVHDQVLAAGLASESEGVEPRRFVVVLPA